MKYIDEFQDPELARRLLDDIHATVTRPWALMEVCGGQTHTIIRHGIDQLLPEQVELIHGPGCPVCVTPLEVIDKALEIASRPEVIFCSFGDMLRVPGTGRDLFRVRGEGGDVRVVYSPLDALQIAQQNPDREVVFFGIGFETTAPAQRHDGPSGPQAGHPATSACWSRTSGCRPAIEAIMHVARAAGCRRFLAAGHVCSVMGMGEYPELAERFRVPIVVTGFEPLDILEGVRRTVRQLERGEHTRGERLPARRARRRATRPPRPCWTDVFEVTDRAWRGIGVIPRQRLAAVRRATASTTPSTASRSTGIDTRGTRRVPQRRGAAGAAQAARVRGVRHHLHPAHPARRHHGLQRGRLRRLLPLPPARTRTTARWRRAPLPETSRTPRPDLADRGRPLPTGPAPRRCATSRAW